MTTCMLPAVNICILIIFIFLDLLIFKLVLGKFLCSNFVVKRSCTFRIFYKSSAIKVCILRTVHSHDTTDTWYLVQATLKSSLNKTRRTTCAPYNDNNVIHPAKTKRGDLSTELSAITWVMLFSAFLHSNIKDKVPVGKPLTVCFRFPDILFEILGIVTSDNGLVFQKLLTFVSVVRAS